MDSVGIFANLLSEYEKEEQNKQSLIHIRRRIRSNLDPFDVVFRPYSRVNKEAFALLLHETQRHHRGIKYACSVPVILKRAVTLRFCAEGGYTKLGLVTISKKFKPTKLIQK